MDDNIPVVVKFEEFKEFLIKNEFFNEKSLSDLLSTNQMNDKKSQIMTIIADIETRDQTEIDRFAQIMRNSDQVNEELLEPLDQCDGNFSNVKSEMIVRLKELLSSPKACGEVLSVINASKIIENPGENVYKMTSNPRGFCVIIDNQLFARGLPFRTGSRADADRLSDVFKQLAFTVFRVTNQTTDQIKRLLRSMSQKKDLVRHDALAVIILSHGIREQGIDMIYGSDGLPIPFDEILQNFNNKNCPLLRHKPKMFFLSACRGSEIDAGVEEPVFHFESTHSLSGSPAKTDHLPTWSDFFVYYSTIGGFASLRNTNFGSWFGYELAHSLAEFAHKEHLNDLVTTVVAKRVQERSTLLRSVQSDGGEEVCVAKQAIESKTKGMVKKLYFNPGL